MSEQNDKIEETQEAEVINDGLPQTITDLVKTIVPMVENNNEPRAEQAKYIDEHQRLIIVLNEAADIFEEAKSDCLNKKVCHFKSKVKSGREIDAFVEVVLERIRILPIPGLEVFLNFGDISSAIAGCIKCCMQNEKICGRAYEKYTQPIISDTHVAWVKCEFIIEQVVTTKCISKKRYVELESIATFFCFSNQNQFHLSLSRAFHVVREQKAMHEMKKRNEMDE